jgi:hypothetical protein
MRQKIRISPLMGGIATPPSCSEEGYMDKMPYNQEFGLLVVLQVHMREAADGRHRENRSTPGGDPR